MSLIQDLAKELSRLPGIGAKTATRLTYHLLKGRKTNIKKLARALERVADSVHPCPACGYYCESDLCSICADPARLDSTFCVVEEAHEVGAVERAGSYRGRFHVLGGRISPLDGVGPEDLSIDRLLERVGNAPKPREVILATNASLEGEATAVYLEQALAGMDVAVTRLARGIPVGSDLEYVDGTTLAAALEGRRRT